jgi:chromosome segregation ATPase
MYRELMLCIILSAAITGCATSNDPRKGGFFGGVAGLNSGAYDARVQQRQDELNRQRNVSEELKQESRSLDSEAQQKESELAAERQRLNEMEKNLSSLQADVDRLKAKSDKQKGEISKLKKKIKDARQKLSAQQTALDELDRAGGAASDPDRYRVLEQERNSLAELYKKLLEYSKALSNAAK